MNIGKIAFGAFVFAIFSFPAKGGEYWTWKDASGRVYFGDRPAEGAVGAKRLSGGPQVEKNRVPVGMETAVRDFPVVLFTNDCGKGCDEAVALLGKYSIPYDSKNPAQKEVFAEFKKHSPSALSPTVLIGSEPLVGFDEGKWVAALEKAGYPLRTSDGKKRPADKAY